jgi:choline transport protein
MQLYCAVGRTHHPEKGLSTNCLSSAIFATGLGAIPLGSDTAFLDLAGSFVILSTVSYAIPFACNVINGRSYIPQGPFRLGRWGYAINLIAVMLIIFFNIFFCFRK